MNTYSFSQEEARLKIITEAHAKTFPPCIFILAPLFLFYLLSWGGIFSPSYQDGQVFPILKNEKTLWILLMFLETIQSSPSLYSQASWENNLILVSTFSLLLVPQSTTVPAFIFTSPLKLLTEVIGEFFVAKHYAHILAFILSLKHSRSLILLPFEISPFLFLTWFFLDIQLTSLNTPF